MISYILPTHNRPGRLKLTLAQINKLPTEDLAPLGGGEIVIVDNATVSTIKVPQNLPNGLPIKLVGLETNMAAASRNIAAQNASGDWLIMLDDDSYPLDNGFVEVLVNAPTDVAAIGADIRLLSGQREAGGLPEVIIGCGAAIRRDAFLAVGGYEESFHYYVEEYDLCAKLLLAGHRVIHDMRFSVMHEKVSTGRDMNVILKHLVRNNGWVTQRYAPDDCLANDLRETIVRYGQIAKKESAESGYLQGIKELFATLTDQPRKPMSNDLFDRFTGVSHVRSTLEELQPTQKIALVHKGKNCWVVEKVLREMGVKAVDSESDADLLMIGTLSPGPMIDAWQSYANSTKSAMLPWRPTSLDLKANSYSKMPAIVGLSI
ncbi:MAG: glycosyltransferase [Planctomycetes bacterium]|nr:glycosyltransferase [Planctomycetota bacterium]